MVTTALLLLLYLAVALGVMAALAWIPRFIPPQFLLAFWLLPMVFLFPCFFTSRTPVPVDHAMLLPPWSTLRAVTRYNANLNDPATEMVPWAKAVRMAWKEGALPLRDRWNGCGMPLAANSQSAAFSPLTLLMMPLPLARAFTLAVAVKLFLALCGMWLWLVELRVSRGAALFAAVSFAFSCAMTPWLLFPHTSVICLWPWALFSIELLQDEAVRRRAFWMLVLVFLFWHLGGHPESAALGACFAGLWLLARAVSGNLRRPAALFGRIAIAAAAAIGLSAFLLLPEIFAIAASNRLAAAEQFWNRLPLQWAPHGPAWWNGIFTAFFPRSLGDAVTSPMIEGTTGSFSEMSLAYFGIAGWALALSILRPGSARRRTEWTLLAPLLLGFAASIALWPAFELLHLIPGLRLMPPLRSFSWVALAGAAIAAFELDRLRADLSGKRRSSLFFLLLLAALAVFGLAAYHRFRPFHAATGGLLSQRNALVLALLALAGAAVAGGIAAWKRRAIAILPLLLTVISGAELLRQGRHLYRFGDPADLFPQTPLLAFLQSRPGPFRVLGEGATLFPSSNVFAGLEEIRTYDPTERRDYVAFLDAECGYDPAAYIRFIRDVDAPALDFLNVRYLVSTPGRTSPGEKWKCVYSAADGTVFENLSVLPRVFAPASFPLDHRENGRVLISDYSERTNSAFFRARVLPGKGQALVLASLVQDGGWTAQDGAGRPIPTERAWGPFLALRLPEGEHAVRLRYSPPGFLPGLGISLATLCALAALAFHEKRRMNAL